MKKRSLGELAGTPVLRLEEKGRASEGAAGGAVEGGTRAKGMPSRLSPGDGHEVATLHRGLSRPSKAENWKTIGAVAADIVARCQRSKYKMTCAN